MPLTAIVNSTQDRIVIFEDWARAYEHREELVCPVCDTALTPVREHFRKGHYVQAHARHQTTKDHVQTEYRYHPESPAHLAAKAYLAINAQALFGINVVSYEFEVRLPEVRRIADVRLLLDTGEYLVIEAQLAAITPEELQERTDDYGRLGYVTCWCLGREAYKDYNYRWCLDQTGACGILNFREEVVTLASATHNRIAA